MDNDTDNPCWHSRLQSKGLDGYIIAKIQKLGNHAVGYEG